MSKFRELTPEQKKEEQDMINFYNANKARIEEETQRSQARGPGVGTVESAMNSATSRQARSTISDKIDKDRKEIERKAKIDKLQEEALMEDRRKSTLKDYEDRLKEKAKIAEGEERERLEAIQLSREKSLEIERRNEEIRLQAKSELERLYHQELTPELNVEMSNLQQQIEELKSKEDEYEIITAQYKDHTGGISTKTSRVLKTNTKAEIQRLKMRINEIQKPVNKVYRDILEGKREEYNKALDGLMEDVSTTDFILHSASLGLFGKNPNSKESKNISKAIHLLDQSIANLDANINDSGFWRASLDKVTDADFYTVGLTSLDRDVSLLRIANKFDRDEELTKDEIIFLEAYNAHNESSSVASPELYQIGSGVVETLPWMAQFAMTSGTGTAVRGGVELALAKATKKYLGKAFKNTASKHARKAIANVSGVYAQAALMPATYESIAERWSGELQVTRNDKGQIDKYFMRDDLYQKVMDEETAFINEIKNSPNSRDENGNLTEEAKKIIQNAEEFIENSKPMSLLGAVYEGFTDSAIAAITERIGGERVMAGFKRMGITGKVLPNGKFTDRYRSFKKKVGWDGILPEFIEESMEIPLNATFIGDSEYSELWDGQQQLRTLAQVAITGVGMSSFHQTMNLAQRTKKKNREYFKAREEAIKNFRVLRDTDEDQHGDIGPKTFASLPRLMEMATDPSRMGDVLSRANELREQGKEKEADQVTSIVLQTQMMRAFDTNTVEEFSEALTDLALKPGNTAGLNNSIAEIKADIKILERTKEKFGHLPNSGAIVRLQQNKITARKGVQAVESQMRELEEDVSEDIKAYARQHNIEVPDFTMDSLFTKEFEDKEENDKYQKFLSKIRQSGLMSVSQFENLESMKKTLEGASQDSRLLFNEQISPEFQQKLKDEKTLKDTLYKNKEFKKSIKEATDDYSEIFDKIAKENKGTLSDSKIQEMKHNFDLYVAEQQATRERVRQDAIYKKTKEVEAKNRAREERVKTPEELGGQINEEIKDPTDIVTNVEPELTEEQKREVADQARVEAINEALNGEFTSVANDLSEHAGVLPNKRGEVNDKSEAEVEVDALERTTTQVQDLSGNTYPVNESDITTYETESGPIRYITNENGDMVMLSDKNTDTVKPSDEAIVVKPGDPGFFDFDAPKELADDLSPEQEAGIKDKIKGMYDILKRQLLRDPTFKDLVNKFIDTTSLNQADEFYNVLAKGWELNKYSKVDFDKSYNDIFDPFKSIAEDLIKDESLFAPNSEKEVKEENAKIQRKAELKEAPIDSFDLNNTPIRRTEGRKTVTSGLKLGFLAFRYTERVNDQGVIVKETTDTKLVEDGVIDIRDLLDFDQNQSGTRLSVRVPSDEELARVNITVIDSEGERKSILYNDWLADKLKKDPNFENTQEYIDNIPMIAYSVSGKPLAYIHNVDWYRPENVGYDQNPPMQAKIIKEAQEKLTKLRKGVLDGSISTITIDVKTSENFDTLPDSMPLKTLTESNPQSVIAIAGNRGQITTKGGTPFENKNRVIVNKEDFEKNKTGHPFHLRRMGVDSEGRQTWRAFATTHGDIDNFYRPYASQIQAMRWGLAAHLAVQTPAYTSYFKGQGREMEIDLDKAKDIVEKVLKETGIDLSTTQGIKDFLRLYANNSGLDFNTLSLKLFNPDPTINSDFQSNVSKEGVAINHKMVDISENGEVTALNQTYDEYIKDYLKSNVVSVNIGTKENPKYVTSVQPRVEFSYEQNENVNEDTDVEGDTVIDDSEKTVKEQAEEAAREVKEEMEKEDSPEAIEQKALDLLNKLNFNPDSHMFDSPMHSMDAPVEITDTSIIETIFNTTKGLTELQEYQLIDFIFNQISSRINVGKETSINKELLFKEIQDAYTALITPSRNEVVAVHKQISELYESNPEKFSNLAKVIEEYNKVINIYENIEGNWSSIEAKTLEKLYKYTGITEVQDFEDTNQSQREKDYSKTSLEENSFDKTSYKLRRFFAGIEDKTPDGQTKKGFLNLPTYVPFQDAYKIIAQILSSPTEIESSFDLMIAKLEQAQETHKWLPEAIKRLKEADPQIKKEFTYNYTKHTLSMKFAMYHIDKDGNYILKVYDTNANEITRVIRDTWKSNFIISDLVNSNQEYYEVNKVKAQQLKDEFESWGENKHTMPMETVRTWLNNFGIVLSKDAFKELTERGMYYNGENIPYEKMFKGNDVLFGLLDRYLGNIVQEKNTEFEENENNHPFTDMSGVLQTLAQIESKYTTHSMTLSFRDNGKSIFGLTPNKFVTDRILALKQYDQDGNNDFVKDLLDLSMSSESMYLKLLELEQDFRTKLAIDHIGVTSFKQLGKDTSPNSGITDLNSMDHDVTKMTGFQDTRQGTVRAAFDQDGEIVAAGNGISMRMGRMFLPTMSDKSQMLMLNTAVLNLMKDKNKAFDMSLDGVVFREPLQKILFNQIIKPELKRIINFHTTVNHSDIKGYDLAAQIFNFVPELNNIKDEDGFRMIELIANNPKVYTIEKVQEEFGDQINTVMKNIIDQKVSEKKESWNGALEKNKQGDITKIKFMDKSYLAQTNGTLTEKFDVAMYDFVINSFISNANMFSTIAGDPAMYSQDKLYSKFPVRNSDIIQLASLYGKENLFRSYNSHDKFLKHLDELYLDDKISKKLYDDMSSKIKPSPFTLDDKAYNQIAKDVGVNIGKRLALLIAPGNKIADSKNSKYLQLFLSDVDNMSENMDYLIELYYGKDELDKVKGKIDEYKSSNNSVQKKVIRRELSDQFPKIADYMNIESTDAQEYTTLDEHLIVLEGQGRLTKEQVEKISDKLLAGEDLNKVELGLVLQPIKPVYTGQIVDKEQDVLRTVYIKSSSFPLIPQLTKGRALDKLRVKMEQLQKDRNMPVRASYGTANKVGSLKNTVNPFDDTSLENAEESTLVLDRDNFRIQQDVPFKSDKGKEDKVSMGTQIFKLLFGDGMINQTGFMLDGEKVTGKKLYDHFNRKFGELIAHKKKNLFDELGLDDNGQPINQKESITKIQDLLQREATERGYPRQDIEGLSFVEKTKPDKKDSNGNVIQKGETYYEFKIPLWLSSNSNRFESLLNAIVTNRLISQKMPGNSFVVGSEAGFEMQEGTGDINESDIIHVGDYTGGELKGVRNKDGVFTYAEVLVPSKFKDADGNLIDLYEKVDGKYKYLIEEKGKPLKLNETMFDQSLLEQFSFRTPTSAHVSASIIKVAGILPPESGDLMIVPKNFIVQKGLDFDVDKETSYQLWSAPNPKTGKIEAITQKHVDAETNPSKKNALKQKVLENEFIKVHLSIFSNPSTEVQQKINKVLSMKFAQDQANFIEGLKEEGADTSNFTILDDSYQRDKMALGAAGKLAIGVYSNYVTFHGLSQQVSDPIRLMDLSGEMAVPKTFSIGSFVSDGIIGGLFTLDEGRSIAEAFAEKQNTATDNEKEQILGRVNINSHTINVDALLTLLGFDKGETADGEETSIPYLFLSQPILVDYVKMKQESQAITTDFESNREEKIIAQLVNKYSKGFTRDPAADMLNEEQFSDLKGEMSSDNMIKAIKGENNVPGMQLAVLQQFLELNEYATKLSALQGVVNTTSLGKSIIESNDKYNRLSRLSNDKSITNGEKLIGDYIPVEEYSGQEGYLRVGDFYIKPTTPQGQIVVNGVKVGNDLWNEYFPYADTGIEAIMEEVLKVTEKGDKSDRRKVEEKMAIFKDIKRYLNSYFRNGLFTEKASIERKKLFIDSDTNTSLAKYLNNLKINDLGAFDNADKKGVYSLKTNRLFSKFETSLNTNGEPSIIKFNNTSSENFDEDYLYTAIAQMVINKNKLPDKNGQPYDTNKLASELVAYAYLEGGVQEAIQFVKYVPIEYLETLGFTEIMQEYGNNGRLSFRDALGIRDLKEDTDNDTHTFVKQYIQHNPQLATQYSQEEQNRKFGSKTINKKTGKLETFILFEDGTLPKFVSVKNKTKSKRNQDKFSLFQHLGNGNYKRISILGTHGMQEYEIGSRNATSLLDSAEPFVEEKKTTKVVKSPLTTEPLDKFDVSSGKVETILDSISETPFGEYKHLSKLANLFKSFLGDKKINVVVQDTLEHNGVRANGRYILNPDGTITLMLDPILMNSNNHEKIAAVFMHELTHALTVEGLSEYFDSNGKQIKGNLPPHIARVNRVFAEVKRKLGPELIELIEKRKAHLEGRLPSETTYTRKEMRVLYAGMNIFEFMTVALTEPDFQKEMNKTDYSNSKESLWEKFKSAIINILFANNININKKSITYEALSSILEYIDTESGGKTKKKNTFVTPPQSDVTIDDINSLSVEPATDINKALGEMDSPMSEVLRLPDLCS